MNSLKALLRSRYNCSVAETGFKEKWGRAQLSVCVVSDSRPHVDEQLQEIGRFSENHHLAQLSDYHIEFF